MVERSSTRQINLGKHETVRFNIMVVGESGVGTIALHSNEVT
jgi:septin family protein